MRKILLVIALVLIVVLSNIVWKNNHKMLYNFCQLGKCGYVDMNDEVIIPAMYDETKPFQYGVCVVKYKGFYGAMTRNNKNVLPFRYAYLKAIAKNEFMACSVYKEDGTYADCGVVDKNEKVIVPFKYFEVQKDGGKYYVKDTIDGELKPL